MAFLNRYFIVFKFINLQLESKICVFKNEGSAGIDFSITGSAFGPPFKSGIFYRFSERKIRVKS